MTESLTVKLGDRSYPLHFGADLTTGVRQRLDSIRAERRSVAVVTDRRLLEAQADAFSAMLGDVPRLVVEPGEGSKSVRVLEQVLNFLAEQKLDRTSVLFAVGGGVIGDLAGFGAAAYLRGIEFIQIPTTLLAMVDSSVGGKTGINLQAGKNLVGAFHQPGAVFISTHFLETLSPREFAAGMAEVIKYGLLGCGQLFHQLEAAPLTVSSVELPGVIRSCCALKAKIVEADERELAKEGGRALLNLGHTFGHAIEQVTGYGAYLHGEAVAIGLVAAARLSDGLGLISQSDVDRVKQVLAAHHLPTRLRTSLPLDPLLAAMSRDKKVRAGSPRFVVLTSLGASTTTSDISPALVEAAFREIGAV